jgi:PBP1b-binding outer membrane lipoprotein LpoB
MTLQLPSRRWFALLALGLLLAGCSTPAPAATSTPAGGEPQRGLALVQSLEVAPPAADSAQVQVTVRGQLADACTALADVDVQ